MNLLIPADKVKSKLIMAVELKTIEELQAAM